MQSLGVCYTGSGWREGLLRSLAEARKQHCRGAVRRVQRVAKELQEQESGLSLRDEFLTTSLARKSLMEVHGKVRVPHS